jgi:opacity protein-like surface antigen
MRSKNIIVAVATGIGVALFAPLSGKAQAERLTINVNYNVAMPLGSFHDDFVSKTSFSGWTANILYAVSNKVSVGFGTGYQDFYQKYPRQVYKLNDGSDISAVMSNSIQTLPLLLLAQYNLLPGKGIQPYVGVGAGGNLVMYKQYLGEFASSSSKFKLAVRPEAGVFIPFKKDNLSAAGIQVNGSYNYMPYNSDGLDNLNNWGVGVGVRFPLH